MCRVCGLIQKLHALSLVNVYNASSLQSVERTAAEEYKSLTHSTCSPNGNLCFISVSKGLARGKHSGSVWGNITFIPLTKQRIGERGLYKGKETFCKKYCLNTYFWEYLTKPSIFAIALSVKWQLKKTNVLSRLGWQFFEHVFWSN